MQSGFRLLAATELTSKDAAIASSCHTTLPGVEVHVDIDEMRSGANRSYTAAGLAMDGASELGRVRVGSGIFGNFAAADDFHGALSEAHRNHVDRLRDHERRLGVLGDKGHTAASAFTDMEQRNAEALRLGL